MPRHKYAKPQESEHTETWATREEVADYLRKDITTVDRMLSGKTTPKLTRHKVGRSTLIRWSEVEALPKPR